MSSSWSSSSSSHRSQDSEGTASTASIELGSLQVKHDHVDLDPVDPDDPVSYDLVAPATKKRGDLTLEERSDLLFSGDHLETIFADPGLFLKFTAFLSSRRPESVPILVYYLDALKAVKAVAYANAVSQALTPLPGHAFTENPPKQAACEDFAGKAAKAFALMVQEDLPAFVTHIYVNVVADAISRRINGTPPPSLRGASEGLAEVFCLTDPSRPDNPIVFASEEFHRMTQYGVSYALGRNCRFLQGEKTSLSSISRLSKACKAGKEHCELVLNYRRDGSAFMNLLMMAPLCDSRGRLRYYIGAQVDVSGLVKDGKDLESLGRLIERKQRQAAAGGPVRPGAKKDEFQDLAEMLNCSELDTARRWGGRMHSDAPEPDCPPSPASTNFSRPRPPLRSTSPGPASGERSPPAAGTSALPPPSPAASPAAPSAPLGGPLAGAYQHYLLVRPYPSLRILFASPTLRVPGILQSPLMARVGGSDRVRTELAAALEQGRGVTAKVRWLARPAATGRWRWVHCTPLLGANGRVGVWMVVLVDDDDARAPPPHQQQQPGATTLAWRGRRLRRVPPVPLHISPRACEAAAVARAKSLDRWRAAADEGVVLPSPMPARRGSLERLRDGCFRHASGLAGDGSLKSPAGSGYSLDR